MQIHRLIDGMKIENPLHCERCNDRAEAVVRLNANDLQSGASGCHRTAMLTLCDKCLMYFTNVVGAYLNEYADLPEKHAPPV